MKSSRVRAVAAGAAALTIAVVAAMGAVTPAFATSPDVTQTFSATGAVQTWVVPPSVTKITVDLSGGQGGASYGGGGLGAELTGTLSVTPGATLNLVVGGYGSNGNEFHLGAGGGGGSFIYTTADLSGILAAAGGGGGAASNTGATSASTSTPGTAGGNGGGGGGTDGNGGQAGTAGGGGGLLTDGTSNSGGGGQSLANGAAGGGGGAAGAFGGGAGTSDYAGAGGGGYSGGGGGLFNGNNGGGGGGGSYFAGSLTSADDNGAGGPGFIDITYVVPTITAVTPATGSARGGTSVTITGAGFTGASEVDFGGVAATSFTVISDTTIKTVTPSSSTGAVDVTVVGADGPSATATDSFTFVPALASTGTDVTGGLAAAVGLLLAGFIISAFTLMRRRRALLPG